MPWFSLSSFAANSAALVIVQFSAFIVESVLPFSGFLEVMSNVSTNGTDEVYWIREGFWLIVATKEH